MSRKILLLAASLVLSACSGSGSDNADAAAGASDAPPSTAAGTPQYIVSDTAPYENLISSGQLALLRRGAEIVDTIDVAFGAHVIGHDSILFLPVRSDSDGTGGISRSISEHVLFDGRTRTLLRDIVPHFDAGFSSPSVLEGALYYWGLFQSNGVDSVQAVRYEFARKRLNQIPLPATWVGTDDRFYFQPPFLQGKEFVFKSPTGEWRFRTPKQR